MRPEALRAAAIGAGAAMLIFAWSMVSGPIGTLAAIGLVLLLVAR